MNFIKLPLLLILSTLFIVQFAQAQSGKYGLDVKNSEVEWTGYHPGKSYEHWGTLKTRSGFVQFQDGNITAAEVVIDMNTLQNTDLINDLDKQKLAEHLKSEEFFNVEKFPEAKLKVKSSKVTSKGILEVVADITIKGITKEINFEATVLPTYEDGYKITAEVMINRLNHDVLFGWSIEDAMIDKEIMLDVMLIVKQSDKLRVNVKESEVEWTGYHPGKSYEHWGTLKVKSGEIGFKDDNITSGEIIIDMNTLQNTDLTNDSDKGKLEEHLKSEEFFHVEEFPEAKLVIKKSEKVQKGILKITADMTIKGITKEVQFEAQYTPTFDDGMKFTAELMIDRVAHKVMFGWAIEDAMIDKEIKLDVLFICN